VTHRCLRRRPFAVVGESRLADDRDTAKTYTKVSPLHRSGKEVFW